MKTIYWNQAKIGDSALVNAENKMGVILKQYGQSFYLTFVDGSSKTYDASELTFYSSDDDYDQYDKGGNVETGSAHIYINFQNSNIDVYHGDDYWLLAKAEPMLVIENAKPGSWNELWESIRSIVSDDSNLGANKKNMGAAHVYISKSNGNIYVYHGDDVTEGKKPRLLFSKQNVKKDSWQKIWITLNNLESVKMKNGGSIKEATKEQWKSILTKLLNQFYGEYEDSTPEDYENDDSITVDEAKYYYENFMDRYKTQKSMSQAYSDFYKSLTDEEKKLIQVKTASEQYADAEEHDRNKSYRTITIRKKQNMEKMKTGGVVGQNIVIDYQGDEKRGRIQEITDTGDYIVYTDDGRTVLAEKNMDVISFGEMHKPAPVVRKRFGFFEDGGIIVKGKDEKGRPFYEEFDSYEDALQQMEGSHYSHLDRDSIRYYDSKGKMLKDQFKDGGEVSFSSKAVEKANLEELFDMAKELEMENFHNMNKEMLRRKILDHFKLNRYREYGNGGNLETMNLTQLLDKVPVFERIHIKGYSDYIRNKEGLDDLVKKLGNKRYSEEESTQYDNFNKRKRMYENSYKENVIKYLKNTKMKDGGNINQENNDMLRSQIVEAKHHSEELSRILTSKTTVEPWVIAKMERSTTDLSDVTHYLEGNKMVRGGNINTKNLFDLEPGDVFQITRPNHTVSGELFQYIDLSDKYNLPGKYGQITIKAFPFPSKEAINNNPKKGARYIGNINDGDFKILDPEDAKFLLDRYRENLEMKYSMSKYNFADGGGVGDSKNQKIMLEFRESVSDLRNQSYPKMSLSQAVKIATEDYMTRYTKEELIEAIKNDSQINMFGMEKTWINAVKKANKQKMAHGGMAEHGLKRGDTIVYNSADDVMVIDKKNNQHLINLDKGERYDHGGEVDDSGMHRERFNLSFNYNPGNISNKEVEKIVEQYTKDWKHDNDFDEVSFYVLNLTKEKAYELRSELKMEDVYNIEITKSRFDHGGGVDDEYSDDDILYKFYEALENIEDWMPDNIELQDEYFDLVEEGDVEELTTFIEEYADTDTLAEGYDITYTEYDVLANIAIGNKMKNGGGVGYSQNKTIYVVSEKTEDFTSFFLFKNVDEFNEHYENLYESYLDEFGEEEVESIIEAFKLNLKGNMIICYIEGLFVECREVLNLQETKNKISNSELSGAIIDYRKIDNSAEVYISKNKYKIEVTPDNALVYTFKEGKKRSEKIVRSSDVGDSKGMKMLYKIPRNPKVTNAYEKFKEYMLVLNNGKSKYSSIMPYINMNGVVIRYKNENGNNIALITYMPVLELFTKKGSVSTNVRNLLPKEIKSDLNSYTTNYFLDSDHLELADNIKIINSEGELIKEFKNNSYDKMSQGGGVSSNWNKLNKIAEEEYAEFGFATLNEEEMSELIDMKKASKIAEEEYGEFGFTTLEEDEMKEIIDNNPSLMLRKQTTSKDKKSNPSDTKGIIYDTKTMKIEKIFDGPVDEGKEFKVTAGDNVFYSDVYTNGSVPEKYYDKLERIFTKLYPEAYEDYMDGGKMANGGGIDENSSHVKVYQLTGIYGSSGIPGKVLFAFKKEVEKLNLPSDLNKALNQINTLWNKWSINEGVKIIEQEVVKTVKNTSEIEFITATLNKVKWEVDTINNLNNQGNKNKLYIRIPSDFVINVGFNTSDASKFAKRLGGMKNYPINNNQTDVYGKYKNVGRNNVEIRDSLFLLLETIKGKKKMENGGSMLGWKHRAKK
jgi:hypothetical protein